ncbi:MAG: hypothetical protein JWO05_738 [Gemmatimonadetes bacterium]|nr:hypothetical protein [Gemmatimonadota bacterium]
MTNGAGHEGTDRRVRMFACDARRLRWGAWVALSVLLLIGFVAVAGRALFPDTLALLLDPFRTRFLASMGITDPLQSRRAVEVAAFDANFASHHAFTALHIGAAALFMLLLPHQLSERSRAKPRRHRIAGRLMLGAGLLMSASALFFSTASPWAGLMEMIGIRLATAWFLYAGYRAVRAIRRRDVAGHREWMLRAMAMPLGVVVVRLVGGSLEFFMLSFQLGPRTLFWIAVWMGLSISALTVELWIRSTRVRSGHEEGLPFMFATSRTSMQYPRARS